MSSRPDQGGRVAASPYEVDSLSDVVKFTALAALLAIFLDAAIAHAMLWGNDPYWTYWVTDTLLMATVFGLGTMLFGAGIGRGAIITAVHVTLLTIYYWTLSPIGLPAQPEWLDLERTWITGFPVHLAVYYMGYLGALWLWGRRRSLPRIGGDRPQPSMPRLAGGALAVAVAIVVVTGIVQALLFQEFMGLTWFIMRIAIAVPFTLAWWMLAGSDRTSALVGGVGLAFLLTTYAHFLGPVGLPSEPARLFAENSPPAEVHWLSYRQEFMVMLPLTMVIAAVGYALASRWFGHRQDREANRALLTAGAAAVVMVALGAATASSLGPDANRVTVESVGPASLGAESADARSQVDATLRLTVANRNTHRTPSPPHDAIDLVAIVPGAAGTLEVRATQPIIADPGGRFTTFAGVGFGEWHDGRSGIGLSQLEATKSDVVAFALADVRSGGELVATRVPLQVSAVNGGDRRLDLHLANPGVAALPSGLHVTWKDFDAGDADASENARYLFGGGLLLILLGLMLTAAVRQRGAIRSGRSA